MAKTPKKSSETAAPQNGPASYSPTANNPGRNTPAGLVPSKNSEPKSSKAPRKTKATSKPGTRAASKTQRTRKPRAVTPLGDTDSLRQIQISDDDIRLRAYFIAERRMQSGMPGDSTNDWWEAHRQLQEEASKNN